MESPVEENQVLSPPGPGRYVMIASPAPARPDPEQDRLHQTLQDVKFLLERGYVQAALAAVRAALARNKGIK